MLEDLKYACNSVRRAPLMALASILTLTLGIGLNAGVFTILDGLLFRPRVEKDPASFVHLSPSYTGSRAFNETPWSLSVRDYRAYARDSRALRQLAAWSVIHVKLEQSPDAILALSVTPNFFEVYGLDHMLMGRPLTEAAREAVMSEEMWQNRFASDPHIIGRTIRVNGEGFTVVGITPAGFSGRIRGPGLWTPWTFQSTLFPRGDWFAAEGPRWLTAEGRLAPHTTREQARAELQVIASRLDRLAYYRQTSMVLTNGSFGEEPAMRASLFWIGPLIMSGLTLILLIACTNVAILQLSRAVIRRREMAIRLAIGAGKWRLTRMLLTETLLLTVVAGGAALFFAYRAPWLFSRIVATSSLPVYSLHPDAAVLAYLCLAVLLTACFAGLSPAAESLRVNLAGAMKSGDAWSAAGPASNRSHAVLVSVQVAMSMVLLVTAGLFVRGQWRTFTADPGFETQHVLLVDPHGSLALAEHLRAVPSIRAVAAGSPLGAGDPLDPAAAVQARGADGPERKPAVISSVSPDFFSALGIPILRGNLFAGESEAVVSEALARSFWPEGGALGKRLTLPDGTSLQIAGVARDLRSEHAGAIDAPHIYRFADPRTPPETLVVRFAGAPAPAEQAVQDAIKRLGMESYEPPKTLRDILDQNAERMNTVVRLVVILALTGLLLAVIGIYGVVALAARRRTRELGIRMALGATKPSVIGTVLSSGMRPILWGVGVGLAMAALASRATAIVLARTPFPIVANDPSLYLAVALLLGAVAAASMLTPAFRAAGADPMRALRQD